MRAAATGPALLVAALCAAPASATPTFAIREGATCGTCHVNPSGGGMRNAYGRNVYAPAKLPAFYFKGLSAPPTLDVGMISLGADARVAYIDKRLGPTGTPGTRTIFTMQADLYVAATPFEALTLYYDQGSYGGFEAMGLLKFDLGSPAFSLYVKAGRFMPSYGLRLPNHEVFTRQDIGFGPTAKDQGLELGAYLGPILLQASVLNGAGPEQLLDDNLFKGVAARAEGLFDLGALHASLGGSFYYDLVGNKTEVRSVVVDTTTRTLQGGVHLTAALGRFAYLGEAHLFRLDPGTLNKQDTRQLGFRSFQQLDVLLFRGLDLNLAYEFRESDLTLQSGSAHRVSAGFEFYPLPYAELKFLYRHTFASGPAEVARNGDNEFVVMIHLFF